MKKGLYKASQIEFNKNIIFIPIFYSKKLHQKLIKESIKNYKFMLAEIIELENITIFTNFLGYVHLYSFLDFIKNIEDKNIFFLGLAGSLNENLKTSLTLNVTEIYPSSIFKLFSKKKFFKLNSFNNKNIKEAKGVSVDIYQRETKNWLIEQKKNNIDIVEMEIFPLASYLKKPFYSLVVTTDSVSLKGTKLYNKKQINKEFENSFEFIRRFINET